MNWIDAVRHDIASIKSTVHEFKKFGITVGIVVLFLSAVAYWKQWWDTELVLGIGACGLILIFSGLLFPRYLKGIHRYWMSAAIIIGSIVSRIILCIIFFIILTPVAIIAKLFGKQFLQNVKNDGRESYWIIRDRTKNINYERMS